MTVQGLQARLSGLLMEVQHTPLAPYSSPQCRQLLYQVLLACVCVPCPDPLLLQQAICLFQRGTLDTDVVVSGRESTQFIGVGFTWVRGAASGKVTSVVFFCLLDAFRVCVLWTFHFFQSLHSLGKGHIQKKFKLVGGELCCSEGSVWPKNCTGNCLSYSNIWSL